MSNARPHTPAAVARLLRQEAGFGCVECGGPFVVYHHIIPWEEEEHFRPEDMVAVCPTCHSKFPRLSREEQYRLKESPVNIAEGRARGKLAFDSRGGMEIGSNVCVGTNIFVARDEELLFAYAFDGTAGAVWAQIYDADSVRLLSIRENEVSLIPSDTWDFEFKWDYLIARAGSGDIFFELDFRDGAGKFRADFYSGRKLVSVRRDKILFRDREVSMVGRASNNFIMHDRQTPFIHIVSKEYLERVPSAASGGYYVIRDWLA